MNITEKIRLLFIAFVFLFVNQVSAEPNAADYAASPTQGSTDSPAQVMLVMSVDHELFKKAYSNYSDLNGDGTLNTSYEDSFDYLGYFNSNWCYQYSSGRFQPIALASGNTEHHCTTSSAPWSGNFLNWASMSRMDLLRKILFGGKRSTDTQTQTILERAYLPKDIHAFSRVYTGADSGNFMPSFYPDTVSFCNLSTSENGAPVLRVAAGSASGKEGWPRWSSVEQEQCQWKEDSINNGSDQRPSSSSDRLNEFTLRVEVCAPGKDEDSDQCRQYPSGYSKPAGLLQNYGEDGNIHFGLISGSYEKNISGGVLRKNISPIAGNTDSTKDEINLSDGVFKTSVNGIIQHVNRFRITGYNYNANDYSDCWDIQISIDNFKANRSLNSGTRCTMWGNPLAEMYLEAVRYFAGSTTPSFLFNASNDSSFISGLETKNWTTPLTISNACASCAIIVLSSSLGSFDADELGSSSDIPGLTGSSSVSAKTNEVGNLEYNNNFAGNYFYGGQGSERFCSDKSLSQLSDALGLCPEQPQLEGSYQIAGLAYHARNTDLRPSLSGMQNIQTYTVQLAESVPNFTIDVDGKNVVFQPVCQSKKPSESVYRDCSLVDVVVEKMESDQGSLRFIWEDSLWGSDYDSDSESVIRFCVGSKCGGSEYPELNTGGAVNGDQVRFNIKNDEESTFLDLRFSYTLSGTTTDGLEENYILKKTSSTATSRTATYTATGNTAGILPAPLQLAAKYGGFRDLDNDGTPNHDANGDGTPEASDTREWDNRNNQTSSLGADGIPDNYFFPSNPALLETQLGRILKDIASRISAGSGAALVSGNSSGVGGAIQALFRPKVTVNNIEINWVGLMHSLFIDPDGHLREDSNGNAALDDYATDKAVTLFYDPSSNQTVLQRYTSNDNGKTLTPQGNTVDLTELKPVWDARERLMEISNANILTQRSYSSPSSSGRHILTWIDSNNNNVVDIAETLPFEYASFIGNEGYLGVKDDVANTDDTEKLVKYIRGEDQPGYRSRSVDYNNDGNPEVWRLGDIIHSSPVSVAAPKGFYSENRSFNSNDATFINFQTQYQNRRQVIYIGGNDGMIHAFNGGFWDNENNRFLLSGGNGETSHPLGGEIWAYAPMNLLPHLRWLSEPDYPHVYYMDGSPVIFDANIFPASSTHPGGWGTVLVMGMRLGGGPIDATIGSATKTMRSAYVVMDITDPEQPPKLLAEVTHPQLGFTTAQPVVIQRRFPDGSGSFDTPSENNWYLAFGSGPIGAGVAGTRSALDNATSDQNMKVFIYDLKNKNFLSGFAAADSGEANAYAGAMSIADWNNDFYDDAIYFGSVGTSGSLSGKLMRINLADSNPNNWSLGTLVDVGRPITSAPTTVGNTDNERWIFSGTGRELIRSDSRSTTGEYYFGVKEPVSGDNFTYGTVPFSSLVDTTDVQVEADGDFISSLTIRPGTSVSSFENLLTAMKSETGWINRLEHNGSDPAGKSLSPAVNTFALLLFTEYVPPADQCLIDGLSYLQALHYQTGTAIPANTQSVLTTGTIDNNTISTRRISLGAGLAPAPALYQGADGKTSVIIQGGAGNISSTALEYKLTDDGRQSWRQIFDIPR